LLCWLVVWDFDLSFRSGTTFLLLLVGGMGL
jgi:hypothetical protein